MDIESILTFIAFLVFAISLFGRKKKKNTDPSGKPVKKTGLAAIIEQIKKEIQSLEAPAGPSPKNQWEQVTSPPAPASDPDPSASDHFEEELSYLDLPEEEPEASISTVSAPAETQREKTVKKSALQRTEKKKPGDMPFSFQKGNLQKAVVWSEIISKPLGLRE